MPHITSLLDYMRSRADDQIVSLHCEMDIERLHIVPEAENGQSESTGMLQGMIEWLDHRLPLLLRPHIPRGRLSTEHLLFERTSEALCYWRDTHLPDQFIRELVGLIAELYEWPNCYFIPDDPFWLVALPRSEEEFPIAMLQIRTRQVFRCDLELEEISSYWTDKESTLKDFANLLYARSARPLGRQGPRT